MSPRAGSEARENGAARLECDPRTALPSPHDAGRCHLPPAAPGRAGRARLRSGRRPGSCRLIAAAKIGGALSFAVLDANSGEVLEARAAEEPLPPASALKAMTALYALETLGPARRFATRLLGYGPLEAGILNGDLVLQGGGDPTLDTLALARLVADLRAQGLRQITGRFLVDESALPALPVIDPGQPEQAGYNPGLSGLNLNFNRVFFEWQRRGDGYAVTMDARAGRLRPPVGAARMAVVDRGVPLFTYDAQGSAEAWTVAREALGENGGRWLPVRRPGLYAGDVFRAVAAEEGLALPVPEIGRAADAATVLARVDSPPVEVLIAEMLEFSTNITAEVLGLASSNARGGDARSLAGSAATMAGWASARHGVRDARPVDHSGLGDGSRITALALARLLSSAGWEGPLRRLMRPIRFSDDNGHRIPNHPVEATAKTGTLHFVNALAGYARSGTGRPLVFAILGADLERRAAIDTARQERPMGARPWAVRSRRLQQRLIEAWTVAHG
ncbi:MAG: D-alanyl-D-alanine carboxypeptidase/D-alanyl-D-alanine-endopeptidase [Alphaproteobacteria bacterium HGW-Alphaproteobacteria-2]|nr:MAG: D-alanyl-D-alanine carboxypeptidase/D-alanyl-D-alanine-endopeptidase [Alphaproteobacteria bacterium HGW-Alphaproteobacteria-2]